jgi:hypothetical protein
MWDKLAASFAWHSDHCYITLDNSQNDFALVDVGDIDGALGSTFVWRDCPEIESIDIMMANLDTQSFANPDEAFGAGTGLSSTGHFAVLHELGTRPSYGIASSTSGRRNIMSPLNGVQGGASSNLAVPTNQIKKLEQRAPTDRGALSPATATTAWCLTPRVESYETFQGSMTTPGRAEGT